MYGTIVGDVIGSVYEFHNVYRKDIPLDLPHMRFTDDTVLTVATMDAIMHPEVGYAQMYKQYFRDYYLSDRGFGGRFFQWGLSSSLEPYNSYGNGSAMRIAPVAYIFDTIEDVLAEAKRSAEVTHNHPEGIKGAQAIALAIFLARKGYSKADIEFELLSRFDYDLSRTVEQIRDFQEANGIFEETCPYSVPEAIICFFEAKNFEDTIRTAISIGGDSDTIACMAGSIAEAYYGIEKKWITFADENLDRRLREVVHQFYAYINKLKD